MDKMNNFIMEIDANIIFNEIINLIENGEKFFDLPPISDIDLSDINDRMDYIYEVEYVLAYGLIDYVKDAIYKYLDGIQYTKIFSQNEKQSINKPLVNCYNKYIN